MIQEGWRAERQVGYPETKSGYPEIHDGYCRNAEPQGAISGTPVPSLLKREEGSFSRFLQRIRERRVEYVKNAGQPFAVLGLHQHRTASDGVPLRLGLAGDVDHVYVPRLVEVVGERAARWR